MKTEDWNNQGMEAIVVNLNGKEDSGRKRFMNNLDEFIGSYEEKVKGLGMEDLEQAMVKIKRSRKEFDATRFFILVVGPVKSGKSTLVNIFARKYVSPTAFRECTALPTIIGKAEGGHLNHIVQFFLKGSDFIPEEQEEANCFRKKVFNNIVDVLRGVESAGVIEKWVETQQADLTKENVDRIVALQPGAEREEDVLLVSIGVEGKGFIDDEIVLIDMPGLDGKQVNPGNMAVYKAMAERADFIFFVQSTTTAINNATNRFLTDLFEDKVKKVPVRLIHNIHDSQYFCSDEIVEKAIAGQVAVGRECIQKTFGIKNFDDIAVNLGMINSGLLDRENLKEEYQQLIDQKVEEYRKMEEELMGTLRKERQSIKDKNCMDGSTDEIKAFRNVISVCRGRIEQEEVQIRKNIDELNGLEGQIDKVVISDTYFLSHYDHLIVEQKVEESWEVIIKKKMGEYQAVGEEKCTGKDLKSRIDRYVLSCSDGAPTGKGTQFRNHLEQALRDVFMGEGETLRKVVEGVKEKIERIAGEVQIDINYRDFMSLLSEKPEPFSPWYFDIKEKCKVVFLSKSYKSQVQNGYMAAMRDLLLSKVMEKVKEYRQVLAGDFIKVRDSLIEEVKKQVRLSASGYEKKQEKRLEEVKEQKALLAEMSDKLKSYL